VSTRVESEQLSPPDRELVRYTLHELVAQTLAAGATALDVSVREVDADSDRSAGSRHGPAPVPARLVSVIVSNHSPRTASTGEQPELGVAAATARSGRAPAAGNGLDDRLRSISGSVTVEQSPDGVTTRTARWPVQS
jgi:hypothetical protein